MTLAQDFEDFVKLLNKHQVDYMVVGRYALAFHGKPRHTGDLDIWINCSETNAKKLVIAIKEFGLTSPDFANAIPILNFLDTLPIFFVIK
jgi:hypothetical protein